MGFCNHRIDRVIARAPICRPDPDLDEFVVLQGLMQFSGQPAGNSAVTDLDNRFQVVGETAQVFFLFFIQLHGAHYSYHGQRFIQ